MDQAKNPHLKSTIDTAASRLRAIVHATEAGTLLGSEETLVAQLGVSRATVRQVARLLEREGLLRVRRGLNGGYFAARPDVRTIESAVSSYLEMVDADVHDTTAVGSALWIEVINKAAGIRTDSAKALAKDLREKLTALKADAPFEVVLSLETEIRAAIFNLINSRYIELIFQINVAFAARQFPRVPAELDSTVEHREFVREWRNGKLLELDAIADGDQMLGSMAARHTRNLWHRRLWGNDDLQAIESVDTTK
jgi:DNA-binding FadR family transcriptional regulator